MSQQHLENPEAQQARPRPLTPTRRQFLGTMAVTSIGVLAAACAPAAPASPTQPATAKPAATTAPAAAGPTTAPAAAKPAATTAPATTGAAAALPKPEKTRLVLGFRLPNIGSQAPAIIAKDKGYFQEAGFEDTQIVVTEQAREGVMGGSLDIGVTEIIDIATAVGNGAPLKVLAPWRNREWSIIAIQPDIASPKELAGKDAYLGGTPGSLAVQERIDQLKAAGFDLTGVNVNAVNVPGGSDPAVKLFLDKKLSMVALFARQVKPVRDSGAKILLETMVENLNDAITVTDTFLAANPNTAAQYMRAIIRGTEIYVNPANKDYVLEAATRNGFTINQDTRDTYENDLRQWEKDHAFDPQVLTQRLEKAGLKDRVPDARKLFDVRALNAAQASLGLTPKPVF